MFHWTPRRIDAHIRLCVLALRMQRLAHLALPLSTVLAPSERYARKHKQRHKSSLTGGGRSSR